MHEPADQAVPQEESVCRFVYDSDKLYQNGAAKPGAFLPMFETNLLRWETSVCRLTGCREERIWHLARTQRLDKTLKARADLAVQSVEDAALLCVQAPVTGFPEHAVLLGWPSDKPAQKEIALRLSQASRTFFPPASP